MTAIPFISARIPSIATLGEEIAQIEGSGIFSNYGPVNTRFETALRKQLFAGTGACMGVCNATIGLMIAMKQAARRRPSGDSAPRYALMPAFTFAAAAQAAIWCGYVPLFCDIDATTWSACPASERRLIAEYGEAIDLIVPYATFGNCIDLAHYETLHQETGAGIVIDAAASLGSLDENGAGFGAGFSQTIVYSMHATKTFGIGEGGVIYSGRQDAIDELRQMGNFGFGAPRSATMPGLNAKLPEMTALLALHRLDDIEAISERRHALARIYRARLDGLQMQQPRGLRPAYQFFPFLVPDSSPVDRTAVRAELKARGVETGAYFSPHLMEQPFLAECSRADDLHTTDSIASRIVSLPLWNGMTDDMVHEVCDAVLEICAPAVQTPIWSAMDMQSDQPIVTSRAHSMASTARKEVA